MMKVAEDMPRMADDIMAERGQRAELAKEIKQLTRKRCNEMRSALEHWKTSRINVSRELAAEIDEATKIRHREINSSLSEMKSSRGMASREWHNDAMASLGKRRDEMKALLAEFDRELLAYRQGRLERMRMQRANAEKFMRDLTSSVSTMLGDFADADRSRAASIRKRLNDYAGERRAAIEAWHRSLHPQSVSHGGSR